MMKRYPLIANFDAGKFATRYSLDPLGGAFYIDTDGTLVVPDNLPDDPPIQEAQDNPLVVLRRIANKILDSTEPNSKVLRGLLDALLDELNLHALKINSILDAVDAATSLADLKTRIGAISDYPQRTMTQAITSIKNHITNGDVD